MKKKDKKKSIFSPTWSDQSWLPNHNDIMNVYPSAFISFSLSFIRSSCTLALDIEAAVYTQGSTVINKYRYNEHLKRIFSVGSLAWLNLSSKFVRVFPCGSIVLATNQLADISAFYSVLKSTSECCFVFYFFFCLFVFLTRHLLPLHPQWFPASKRCLLDTLLKEENEELNVQQPWPVSTTLWHQ